MGNLYDTDYNRWVQQQKEFLINRQFDRLDLDNLIEEVEDMGKGARNNLESHLVILLLHLLKYQHQTYVINPTLFEPKEFRSWRDSISQSRLAIERLIRKNPSLKHELEEALFESYPDAKKGAISEMNQYLSESQKLNKQSYPDTCPWTFQQVMEEGWLPEQ